MYKENDKVESDLINSYSWDTAIVFIQKYSDNSKYSIQAAKEKEEIDDTWDSEFNTGTSGDVVCNIHDMASNCLEWTTEHSALSELEYNYPCVQRGGLNNDSYSYTTNRILNPTWNSNSYSSFRLLLY